MLYFHNITHYLKGFSMDKLREKVTSRGTADCPFQRYHMIRTNPNGSFANIHWHPEPEILYMRHGTVEVRVGKQILTMSPGTVIFILPGQLHAIRALEPESSYDAFVYSLDLLSLPESHFFQKERIAPIRAGTLCFPTLLLPDHPAQPHVAEYLDRICNTPRADSKYKQTIFLSLVQLYLAMWDFMVPAPYDALRKNNETIKLCLDYMNVHYAEHMTLESIAQQVHLHPNYLCALFKDYTGQTVFNHLIRIRIENAAHLLRTENISVSSAAAACGFESTGFFTKKFKAIYGVTPKQYSTNAAKP